MCGIAGYIGKKSADTLKAMSQALKHRGPDSFGNISLLDQTLHFIHRRLAIIDLTETGHQPIFSQNGRWAMTFNGEIYNFKDLKKQLNCNWKGASDSEVLIEMIAARGIENTLQSIQGMYAFAAVDLQEKKLYLARDRAGEKPLYYFKQDNKFIFASELKAIEVHPDFSKLVDMNSVELYFRYGALPGAHSIYSNTKKLLAGHFAVLDLKDHSLTQHRYWDIQYKTKNIKSFEENLNHLETLLMQTISNQCISDAPLGAFLSGGIDSSLVVSLMQKQTSRPVKTFAIGFNDPKLNEAPYAKAVADYLKTDHHEIIVNGKDALEIVPKIATFYDEPFSDFSQIPAYIVSKFARQHVTVALSGDGGDEVFGGYNRYRDYPKILKAPFKSIGASGLKLPFVTKLLRDRFGPYRTEKLAYVLEAKNEADCYERLRHVWGKRFPMKKIPSIPNKFWLSTVELETMMMIEDFNTYLVDDILVKVDRAAMANSLETRAPLLDHKIIEFAFSLPTEQKFNSTQGKLPLRILLERQVPKELINRPKRGFMPPLREWLRTDLKDWAQDLLDPSNLAPFLSKEVVEQTWREHQNGSADWTQHLWSLLMVQDWMRQRNIK